MPLAQVVKAGCSSRPSTGCNMEPDEFFSFLPPRFRRNRVRAGHQPETIRQGGLTCKRSFHFALPPGLWRGLARLVLGRLGEARPTLPERTEWSDGVME